MTSSHPRPIPCQWFSWLAAVLDRRTAPAWPLDRARHLILNVAADGDCGGQTEIDPAVFP